METKKRFVNNGKTIKEMLDIMVKNFPGQTAFKVKEEGKIREVSFFEYFVEVRKIAAGLAEKGLGGQRIAIIADNSYEYMQAFMGIVVTGGVAVPLDKGLTEVELATCLMRSQVKGLFCDKKHRLLALDVLKDFSDVELIVMAGHNAKITEEEFADEKVADGTGSTAEACESKASRAFTILPTLKALGEARTQDGSSSYHDVEIEPENMAVILFTSGTTANSKAVMLSHKNIMSNITDMHHFERFYMSDVNMAFLPLHHSFGLVGVLVFMACGASNVFCDGLKHIQKNLAEYGVTVFVGVPLLVENMYKKVWQKAEKEGQASKLRTGLNLVKLPGFNTTIAKRKIFAKVIEGLGGSVRLIICGAAPLMPETAAGLNGFGIATIQGYGLTETSPVLAAERPSDLMAGSVGKPMPRVRIKIVDKDENGIGEIAAKGPNVMLGYLDQPEETDNVLRDGWFYTGDLGKIDKHGNLWITGRKKNVIVLKNGKNVFPEEIEGLIEQLPYVNESLVFTREKYNELVLWVKIVYADEYLKNMGMTEEELSKKFEEDLAAINENLPKFKHINHFLITDEPMIMTTTQKVKRNLEIAKIYQEWKD